MPNLVNQDSAGNTFYNYITPVLKGESRTSVTNMLDAFFTTAIGAVGTNWNTVGFAYGIRLPASGLEMKTGSGVTWENGNGRLNFSMSDNRIFGNSSNVNSSAYSVFGIQGNTQPPLQNTFASFAVINNFAFVYCRFNPALTVFDDFIYAGWLREPVYTGTTVGVRGLTLIRKTVNTLVTYRPLVENSTSSLSLSTAADAITSPPIVCTPGTDPGDGSETWTDIVIRDAATPNNPVGKLWNCVDAPANYTVGGLYKNVGAYDADGSTSEQDIYLCVMPWGERKLLMRVWAENVFS